MNDLTGQDPVAFYLAYAHPVFMVVSIGLAAFALRLGLRLRRGGAKGRQRAALRGRHLKVAKLAVPMLCVGFAGGPLSMFFLRGRDPFGTAHALVGILALLTFLAAALLGRRLERGDASARDLHAAAGAFGVLLAALAFATGFVLLP